MNERIEFHPTSCHRIPRQRRGPPFRGVVGRESVNEGEDRPVVVGAGAVVVLGPRHPLGTMMIR
jgi:hypothetical protein